MKKVTFMLLVAFVAVASWALTSSTRPLAEVRAALKAQFMQKSNTQDAGPLAAYQLQMPAKSAKARAPRKAAELVTPPAGDVVYYKLEGTAVVSQQQVSLSRTVKAIFEGNDVYVTGLSFYCEDSWVKGTIDGATATFAMGQYLGNPGVDLYFAGTDGETLTDVFASYDAETGNFEFTSYILDNKDVAQGMGFYAYIIPGLTLTKIEGEVDLPVEVPEDLATEEYTVKGLSWGYDESDNLVSEEFSFNVQAGFVVNSATSIDVYVQGLCSYLPEAWVKGTGAITANGVQVIVPSGQLFGTYASQYEMWFVGLSDLGDDGEVQDVVFNFDMANNTLTLAGGYVAINGKKDESYWYDAWSGLLISKVVEKATMPADPEITALKNGTYGWYFNFNVPTVDVNGDGLATSKLSYMIYTDIEGEIAPLTFTPKTHTKLTEALTEIPYGFTENYDFYDTQIYLNDLYSADWNNLGIQSIYRGGDEENATEIQWFHIKDYAGPVVPMESFVWVAAEQGYENSAVVKGFEIAKDIISGTVDKAEGKNDAKYYTTDESLRLYAGNTLTITSAEKPMAKIEFTMTGSKDQMSLEADKGTYSLDSQAGVGTWTGEETEVVFTVPNISGYQARIQKIEVFFEGEEPGPGPVEPEEAIDPDGMTFNFEDGSMQGWTTIDADGDGFTWKLGASPSINTVNGSEYSVYSESYDSNTQKGLTPDNYLVSPKIKLGCPITFYACAQDGSYAAEHFGVAVSTNGKTDAADFTTVEEWTMTASRVDNQTLSRGTFRSPRKAPGAWYKYTVDLSEYEGQEGYVAIRHFDCTDFFYIVVDDITFGTPDFTITPEEGKVESLNDFTITFNNYDIVVDEDAKATLTNTTTSNVWTDDDIEVNGRTLTIEMAEEEITEPGEYTLTITGVKNVDGEAIELSFNYTIEEPLVVVELPEGLEAETWYFSASASESSLMNQEVAVAIDGSDIYIQGINNDYLPEAWVKGTIDAEAGTATFPTGQYFGAYEYSGKVYDMFFVGSEDGKTASDVVFDYDAEAGTLTTDMYIIISSKKDEVAYYEYYYDVVISKTLPETPDLVALPEGVEAEDWTIDATYIDNYGSDNIVRPTEVAFDGTDIYVKGIPFYFEEAWMKGTIDAETGIATFPTGQFVGADEYGWEFMVGSDDFETLCDIEFAYDAEAKTLTQITRYIIENGETPDEISAYGYWSNMIIYEGEPVYEEPIEAPEDLVTENYLFTANVIVNGEEDLARKAEANTDVTFDFNAMDVAVSSGTGDDYDPAGEITETLVLTEGDVTLAVSPAEEGKTPNRFWSTNKGPQLRVYSGTLTFEVPEGNVITQIVFNNGKWNEGNSADSGEFDGATWTGEAQKVVVTIAGNTQINSINVTVAEIGEDPVAEVEPYSYQMQVGFDGSDVYFKGVSDDTADMWLKGTLSEDGKTVTIPANQYMGEATVLWFTFPYYFTAVGEDGESMEDIVLNYDAENSKFTTDQVLVLHDGKRALGEPYQTFTEVEITKMEEFAATPANPEIVEYAPEVTYPRIDFNIPAEDVDGNVLMESKMAYQIFVIKDDEIQPLTLEAALYKNLVEDMTEIPYSFDDSYDIYKGGSRVYLNQDAEEIGSWTNIGVQSIYYGAGECNKSDLVWLYPDDPILVGIANVKTDSKNAVVFDLQGRRVAKTAKGLYIMDGKKVVIK